MLLVLSCVSSTGIMIGHAGYAAGVAVVVVGVAVRGVGCVDVG